MISVIILTENKNYSILEVPANGKLIIRERHLVVGIIQNGVKMIAYGVKNPLVPMEAFIQNDCNSVEMIQDHFFQREGRLLDFSSIELLQAQTTLNPSQSGSTIPQAPVVYYSHGYPVDYNIKIKGATFTSMEEVENWFRNYNTPLGNSLSVSVVNGMYIDSFDYMHISLVPETIQDRMWRGKKFQNMPITEFIDQKGLFTKLNAYGLESESLTYAEFPEALNMDVFCIGGSSLKTLITPKLQTYGKTVGKDSTIYNGASAIPSGLKWTLSNFMQTSNAGALEGDLEYLLSLNKGVTLSFV